MRPGTSPGSEKTVIITREEPWVTSDVAGKLVQFPVDREATYSGLTSHTGPLAPETCCIIRVEGRSKLKLFTTPLLCTWGKTLITYKFLVMLECPSPLLGRDFPSALRATFTLPENQNQGLFLAGLCIIQDMDSPAHNISPEMEKLTDPQVWESGNPRMGKICHSLKITFQRRLISSLPGVGTP